MPPQARREGVSSVLPGRPACAATAEPSSLGLERLRTGSNSHQASRRAMAPAGPLPTIRGAMIYCVIPRELADELYDKMVAYYEDNPNVTVIVDRREGDDRRRGK